MKDKKLISEGMRIERVGSDYKQSPVKGSPGKKSEKWKDMQKRLYHSYSDSWKRNNNMKSSLNQIEKDVSFIIKNHHDEENKGDATKRLLLRKSLGCNNLQSNKQLYDSIIKGSNKEREKKLLGSASHLGKSNSKEKPKEEKEDNLFSKAKEEVLLIPQPFKLAHTIYTKLSKQKALFYARIKQNQNIDNIYRTSSHNYYYQSLSQSQNQIQNRQRVSLNYSNNTKTQFIGKITSNAIPITPPIYISYHIKYDSMSQKNRHEKINESIMKLKTILSTSPKDYYSIIREYLIKNQITDESQLSFEKVTNFNTFLKNNQSIDPKKTLHEVLNEALNYTNKQLEEKKEENPNEIMMNKTSHSKHSEFNLNLEKMSNTQSSFHSPLVINPYNTIPKQLYYKKRPEKIVEPFDFYPDPSNQHIHYKEIIFPKKNDLKGIITTLEEEMVSIRKAKELQMEQFKNVWKSYPDARSLKYHGTEDHNRHVPNLCLINSNFNRTLLQKTKEQNDRLKHRMNKQAKIKEINDRMYYGNEDKFDIADIRKCNKLTEYIVLERSKNLLSLADKAKKMEMDNSEVYI